MDRITIFPAGDSLALEYAVQYLKEQDISIGEENATHLLFDVPTKTSDLDWVGSHTTLIGGNLDWLDPAIARIDLLKDEYYVAENAHLTADCALRLLGQHLKCRFRGCSILIIGWGRIGKCLAAMLKDLGAQVTVAARKTVDLAMAAALGYDSVALENIRPKHYQAVVNTAPAPVLETSEGLYIDLASKRGILGENVIWARALPGKMLPESSGKLIADSILRHLREGEK